MAESCRDITLRMLGQQETQRLARRPAVTRDERQNTTAQSLFSHARAYAIVN